MKPLLRFAIYLLATIIVGCLPTVETIDPSTIIEWRNYTSLNGLAGDQINDIAQDSDGNLWIATNNGASKIEGESTSNYRTTNSGLPSNYITSVIEFEVGLMIFGTDAGLSVFDGSNWQTLYFDPDNTPYEVMSLGIDADGYGWVATDTYGLLFTDGTDWGQAWDDQCFNCNFVNTMYLDSKDVMWYGTQDGLKSLPKGGSSFTRYTTSNGLPDNYVQAVFEDSWGEVWIGTYNGLAKKEGNQFNEIDLYNSATQNWAYTINQDIKDKVWIGSIGNGLVYFDGAVMRTDETSLSDLRISTISSFRDKDGTLWMGTYEGGLWKYTPAR